MGKIIRNGIEFSSTVDTANNISYDNSLSGLEATTTQKAIDELNTNLTESLGGLNFAQDAEGKWGYIPSGADAVIPFKSNEGYSFEPIPNFTLSYRSSVTKTSTLKEIKGIFLVLWGKYGIFILKDALKHDGSTFDINAAYSAVPVTLDYNNKTAQITNNDTNGNSCTVTNAYFIGFN